MASANSAIKATAGVSISAVAGIAAIISYSHIYDVAIRHGQSVLDARLLPFSVDGLIASASLALFYASRNRLDSPSLARWMLGLGIGATIAANAIFGWTHGPLGIALSAWPAIAFIGSAELTLWMVRASLAVRRSDKPGKQSDVRRWARMNGYEISDRGRLPSEIVKAYENGRGKEDIPADPDEIIDETDFHFETLNGDRGIT